MTPPPMIATSTAICTSGSPPDWYLPDRTTGLSYRANGLPDQEVGKSPCLYAQPHRQLSVRRCADRRVHTEMEMRSNMRQMLAQSTMPYPGPLGELSGTSVKALASSTRIAATRLWPVLGSTVKLSLRSSPDALLFSSNRASPFASSPTTGSSLRNCWRKKQGVSRLLTRLTAPFRS